MRWHLSDSVSYPSYTRSIQRLIDLWALTNEVTHRSLAEDGTISDSPSLDDDHHWTTVALEGRAGASCVGPGYHLWSGEVVGRYDSCWLATRPDLDMGGDGEYRCSEENDCGVADAEMCTGGQLADQSSWERDEMERERGQEELADEEEAEDPFATDDAAPDEAGGFDDDEDDDERWPASHCLMEPYHSPEDLKCYGPPRY